MSTLKDALSTALQGSPLKKPLHERLWLYIKDHPDVLSISLSSIMKEDSKDVSKAVYYLRIRKMVLGTEFYSRKKNGQRLTYTLRVNPAMRGEYELWPQSKDREGFIKHKPRVAPTPPPVKVEVASEYEVTPEHKVKTLADFEDQPFTSLKNLYSPSVKDRAVWAPVLDPGLSKLDVKTMPLAEARRIYDELQQYFGVMT